MSSGITLGFFCLKLLTNIILFENANVHILLANQLHWVKFLRSQVTQLLKKFPTFYRTRRFITVFTRTLQWCLSWERSIQPIAPHPISPRSTLLFLMVFFYLTFPQKPICNLLRPLSCYMPCPSYSPWLVHSNCIWRKVMKLLIMQFPPTSCHFISLSIFY
jgi:hypothetical protein